MRVLGIESSCDETAASVVEDGKRLLSNVVNSQIDIHKAYGGVVPEIAARSHLEVINPVIVQALADAGCTWDDIDAIAVTYAPGLVGSLLVGLLAARTLAILHDKPLYPVHHVEAHVYANFITESTIRDARTRSSLPASASTPPISSHRPTTKYQIPPPTYQLPAHQPTFPMLALIVSGGHTQLVLFKDHGDYKLLGQTRDDAVGEAFDKVAKILGLPYPGGPSVSKAALHGDPNAYKLPIAKLDDPYSFSFSGLKTAVLRAVQKEVGVDYTFPSHQLAERLSDVQRDDFAASFQATAVKTLVNAAKRAFQAYNPQSVVIAGGVAANQLLRTELRANLPIDIEYAPIEFCTDNGAMIATLGYYHAKKLQPTDPRQVTVEPVLSMTETSWASA